MSAEVSRVTGRIELRAGRALLAANTPPDLSLPLNGTRVRMRAILQVRNDSRVVVTVSATRI